MPLPSDPGSTAKGETVVWWRQSQSKLLSLGDAGPGWLHGPFMETVLGLIIPSCASSPSPAGLRVPVSSANTPHSHWSQGETHRRASVHTYRACTDWSAGDTEGICMNRGRGHNNVNTCAMRRFNVITLQKNISSAMFSFFVTPVKNQLTQIAVFMLQIVALFYWIEL